MAVRARGGVPCSSTSSGMKQTGPRAHSRLLGCRAGKCRRMVLVKAAQRTQQSALKGFPTSYPTAIRQAQEACKAALADGHKLIEVEIPSSSLTSVAGDGEGQNEMNLSMGYLKDFLVAWRTEAEGVRVFFPDNVELAVARSGQTSDPSAGRVAMEAKFDDDTNLFKLGYLTKQNAAWAMLGLNLGQAFKPSQLVKEGDKMFVVAYPSFNPREEMSAVRQLYDDAAKQQQRPLIIFNGELDRLRGGYYPGLFFPELAKITSEFLPKFETAYYIHNFKGTRPGALFRCYPGPWQVLRRNPLDEEDTFAVWTSDKRPSLKEVALEILPNS